MPHVLVETENGQAEPRTKAFRLPAVLGRLS